VAGDDLRRRLADGRPARLWTTLWTWSTGARCTGYNRQRGTQSGTSIADRTVADACTRCAVAGQRQTAALSGAGGVARQSSLDLELQGSVFDAVCTHAKLRSMRTRLEYLEEGSGDLGGARRKGAMLGGRFAGDSR
jgi:hypothetical protein